MILTSYRDLIAVLTRDRVPHGSRPEHRLVELGGAGEPLIVRWEADGAAIQLVQPLPFRIDPARVGAVETLLLRLNHNLRLPGFGLDHEHHVVYYRATIPLPADGTIEEEDFLGLVAAARSTARDFGPAIEREATDHVHASWEA